MPHWTSSSGRCSRDGFPLQRPEAGSKKWRVRGLRAAACGNRRNEGITRNLRTGAAQPAPRKHPGRALGAPRDPAGLLYLYRQRFWSGGCTGTGVATLPCGQNQILAYRLSSGVHCADCGMVQLPSDPPGTSLGARSGDRRQHDARRRVWLHRLPMRCAPVFHQAETGVGRVYRAHGWCERSVCL